MKKIFTGTKVSGACHKKKLLYQCDSEVLDYFDDLASKGNNILKT